MKKKRRESGWVLTPSRKMNSRISGSFDSLSYLKRTYLCFGSFFHLLVIFCISIISLSGCSTNPVSVTKAPPRIKTQIFDKDMRPAEAKKEHNDCANTHWDYGITPEIFYKLNSRKRTHDGEQVSIKITKFKIGLNLDVTMWLPENASPDVVEHEKGHAAICLDNYKNAERLADELAKPFIGKEIVALGPDLETTIREVLTQVKQDVVRKYREETVDKTNITSGLFDQMTVKDHAAANVDRKVADAELEYTRIWPALKAKREEQERLSKKLQERNGATESTKEPSN
ncbi:MAG: hypothetical protein IT343_02670 [Candidatus Melainabacteria bacterium]|nr:hypothetical protein [Candidatus Melainabacteria bacterium]